MTNLNLTKKKGLFEDWSFPEIRVIWVNQMQLFMGSTDLEVTMCMVKPYGEGLPKIRGLKQGDSQFQPNFFGNVPTHGL
jgi:hypothetical protein